VVKASWREVSMLMWYICVGGEKLVEIGTDWYSGKMGSESFGVNITTSIRKRNYQHKALHLVMIRP